MRARAYPHAAATVGLLLVLLPLLFALFIYCFYGIAMLASAAALASNRSGAGLFLSHYGWIVGRVLTNLAAFVAASLMARWIARASAGVVAQLAADFPD